METSLDAQCLSTLSLMLNGIIDDDVWRVFGYRKRPKRGKFFDRFVQKEKRDRERVLSRELWAASFSMVSVWARNRPMFSYRVDFIARLMEANLEGIHAPDPIPVWSVLDFPTGQVAAEFLIGASKDYGRVKTDDYPAVFVQRCKDRLADELPAAWIVGAVRLFSDPRCMVSTISRALDETHVGNQKKSDLAVRNALYRDLSAEAISSL